MSAWRRVRARVKSWHWEYARDGYHGASANLTVVAAALRTEHDRLRAWTAAHAAAPEPEPAAAGERFEEDALPGAATPAAAPGKTRYGKRPCGVPGCMMRVRLDLAGGDRCGNHSSETARWREAVDVRRARERLHAVVRRMV